MTDRTNRVTIVVHAALYIALQLALHHSKATPINRQCPAVACPGGKSPVAIAVDGGWFVRCEVKP